MTRPRAARLRLMTRGTRERGITRTRSPLPPGRCTRTSCRYYYCCSAAAEACWGRGDRGVRDPGPSHSGHKPYAYHNLHHKDSLPPPEAVRGLQGPLDNVDGGEDRGHTPNAGIVVSDKLSKTLQKLDTLDSSIIGRSCHNRETDGQWHKETSVLSFLAQDELHCCY